MRQNGIQRSVHLLKSILSLIVRKINLNVNENKTEETDWQTEVPKNEFEESIIQNFISCEGLPFNFSIYLLDGDQVFEKWTLISLKSSICTQILLLRAIASLSLMLPLRANIKELSFKLINEQTETEKPIPSENISKIIKLSGQFGELTIQTIDPTPKIINSDEIGEILTVNDQNPFTKKPKDSFVYVSVQVNEEINPNDLNISSDEEIQEEKIRDIPRKESFWNKQDSQIVLSSTHEVKGKMYTDDGEEFEIEIVKSHYEGYLKPKMAMQILIDKDYSYEGFIELRSTFSEIKQFILTL